MLQITATHALKFFMALKVDYNRGDHHSIQRLLGNYVSKSDSPLSSTDQLYMYYYCTLTQLFPVYRNTHSYRVLHGMASHSPVCTSLASVYNYMVVMTRKWSNLADITIYTHSSFCRHFSRLELKDWCRSGYITVWLHPGVRVTCNLTSLICSDFIRGHTRHLHGYSSVA